MLDRDSEIERAWFAELYGDLCARLPISADPTLRRVSQITMFDLFDDEVQEGLDGHLQIGFLETDAYEAATRENTRLSITIGFRPSPAWAAPKAVLAALRALAAGELDEASFRARVGEPLPVWLEIVRDGTRIDRF